MFGNGPFWDFYQSEVNSSCSEYWWSPTFFLTSIYPKYTMNLYHPFQGCFSWTWVISVDFICFLFTPFILFIFYKKKFLAILLTVLLLFCFIFSSFLICYIKKLSLGIGIVVEDGEDIPSGPDDASGDFFSDYYARPYTRCISYLFGVLVGLLLHFSPKLRFPFILRVLVYAFIWPCIWFLFFVTLSAYKNGWNQTENWIFAAVHHPAFSLCFALSVYLMAMGHSGPFYLRSFFSARFWLPISRLSYGCYLYAPVIITMTYFAQKNVITYTAFGVIFLHVAITVTAYLVALANYLLIERPFLNLFDYFIGLLVIFIRSRKMK